MKGRTPQAKHSALKHLSIGRLLPKWYLRSDKFCFGRKMVIATGALGTVVKEPQTLCLIPVKQNVTYFLKFPLSERHDHCCCPGERTVTEDPAVAAHSQILLQPIAVQTS